MKIHVNLIFLFSLMVFYLMPSCSLKTPAQPSPYKIAELQIDNDTTEYTKFYFDFDRGLNEPAPYVGNDLLIGTTVSSIPFIVLTPSFGAKGSYIYTQENYKSGDEKFSRSDCDSTMDNFGLGGVPISQVGSYYCWLTNDEKLVEFVVGEISKSNDGTYYVELRYVLFDNQ